MATITSITQPLHWSVVESGVIIEAGQTPVGATTIAADVNDLVSDTDENALLGALVDAGASAPPMPEPEEQITKGSIYAYDGVLYMARKNTVRVAGNPADQVSEWGYYQPGEEAWAWVAGEILEEGALRTYEGVTYELYYDIGDNNWHPPPDVPAHWVIAEATEEWQYPYAYVGDNESGAGNGDVVVYEGAEYRCLQSHTSQANWYPPAAGVINVLWVAN
jgi:hypothetical protein